MPQSQNALVRKLSGYLVLSGEEESRLSELQSKPVRVKGGQELLQEGHVGRKVFIIQSGWASSYKDLPDGGRQIISFPVAGDCVGLRSVLLRTSDHSFSALKPGDWLLSMVWLDSSRVSTPPAVTSAFL